jgi:hypothetical protein
MRKHLKKPSPAMIVACLSLFIALSGVTYAATGGNFILGNPNTATSQTSLSAPVAGNAQGPKSVLQLTNTSTAAGAEGLGITVGANKAPIHVNSTAGKATNLNADKLDGLDSSALRGARAYAFSGGIGCFGAPPVFCPIYRGKGVAYVVRVAKGTYCVGVNGISAAAPTSVALLSLEWDRTSIRDSAQAFWRSANYYCVATEFEIFTRSVDSSGTFVFDDLVSFSIAIP